MTPTPDPLDQLFSITPENAAQQKPTVLTKAPSGAGKTHFWLTAPEPIVAFYPDKNMATVKAAIEAGKDIRVIVPSCWSDWEDVFIPTIENRKVDAATIAVDTLDMLTGIMWREIQGTKNRLTQSDFGTGKNRMVNTITQLCSAASGPKGTRTYNIFATSHLGEVTDDAGALLKITCDVMGAFKNAVEGLFDYVFVGESGVETKIENNKAIKSKRFFLHTIPPSRYHSTKAPDYFPAEIPNTWQGLQDALALNPERMANKTNENNTQEEQKK